MSARLEHVARGIAAHLSRFDRENVGGGRFRGAEAYAAPASACVRVRYRREESLFALRLGEAEEYLRRLDRGFVCKHFSPPGAEVEG